MMKSNIDMDRVVAATTKFYYYYDIVQALQDGHFLVNGIFHGRAASIAYDRHICVSLDSLAKS